MDKINRFFFAVFASTLAAFGVFLAVLFNVDPQTADFVTMGAFFASIFFTVSGFLTLVFFYLRVKLSNWEVLFGQIPTAVRHAVLVALMITGLAFLQMLRVLGWWEAGLYLLVVILLEAFFRSKTHAVER